MSNPSPFKWRHLTSLSYWNKLNKCIRYINRCPEREHTIAYLVPQKL